MTPLTKFWATISQEIEPEISCGLLEKVACQFLSIDKPLFRQSQADGLAIRLFLFFLLLCVPAFLEAHQVIQAQQGRRQHKQGGPQVDLGGAAGAAALPPRPAPRRPGPNGKNRSAPPPQWRWPAGGGKRCPAPPPTPPAAHRTAPPAGGPPPSRTGPGIQSAAPETPLRCPPCPAAGTVSVSAPPTKSPPHQSIRRRAIWFPFPRRPRHFFLPTSIPSLGQ